MKTKVIKKNYLNNMGYKNVRILVRALTFETAEEYFELLINALRNKKSSENFELSSKYFNELIDRIFNENEL